MCLGLKVYLNWFIVCVDWVTVSLLGEKSCVYWAKVCVSFLVYRVFIR